MFECLFGIIVRIVLNHYYCCSMFVLCIIIILDGHSLVRLGFGSGLECCAANRFGCMPIGFRLGSAGSVQTNGPVRRVRFVNLFKRVPRFNMVGVLS